MQNNINQKIIHDSPTKNMISGFLNGIKNSLGTKSKVPESA